MSDYENYIPPGYDRSAPAGGLIDPASGEQIRDLEYDAGWVRGPDGTAIPAEAVNMGPVGAGGRDNTPAVLLLLLS